MTRTMVEVPATKAPPEAKRRGSAPKVLWFAAAAALAPVAIPFAFLVGRAATSGSVAIDTILSARTAELVMSTLVLVAAVSAAAGVIGVGVAWLTERTDLRARRVWRVLAALPLVLPSYVIALTVLSAFGPRGLGAELLGLPLPTVRGFAGAFWALTVATYPFVYLTVAAAMRRLDPELEEAARGLGVSPTSVFRRVIAPQLRRPIGAGVLLAALYTLSDFGAVSLAGYDSFTRVIYAQYAGRLDRTPAVVLAVLLVAIAVGLLAAERRIGRGRSFQPPPRARPSSLVRLSPAQQRAALGAVGTVALFSIGIPVATLIGWVGRGSGWPAIPWGALGGSLAVSLLAATVAVILAVPISVLVVRHSSEWVERASYLAFSIPHITIGLGMVFVASRWLGSLYQSLFVLVAVLVAVFLAQALGATSSALADVSPVLEDAARSLGHGRVATLRRVVIPLMWRGVAAGGLLVFLTTMKELPITLLLRPTGLDTLAVDVWSAAGELLYPKAAVPALLLLAVSAVPTFALATRQR